MEICAIRRDVTRSAQDALALFSGLESVDEVLQRADYLGISLPVTPATRGLIGAKQLHAMKSTAVLVNVSRAEIIDEEALYRALAKRTIAGALALMIVSQGLLGYGLTSVIGAIPAEIFQGSHYGSIFGSLMLAAIMGGAAGPWVTGALHDATGSYTLAFWTAIGCSILSACAIWLAGPRQVRAIAGRVHR